MNFYVPINGIEVRCETIAEAMALAERVASASVAKGGSRPTRGRMSDGPEDATDAQRAEQAQRSLRFLVAVRDAGAKGTGGEKLADAVKCNGGSGLGTVKQVTERLLRDSGLSLDDVVHKQRKGNCKTWFAGPQIKEAIRALEGMTKKS